MYTPSGNWSSWPPHKHDVDDMPAEAVLEEIYYYQFRRPEAWGIQRLYRRDGTRDALWPVRDGELVAKASGADGMHVFVPIERRHGFEEAHAFAETAARLLETRHPGLVTTEWSKAKRNGVLIDYNQNGAGRTTASVYSVRPKPGATVSAPLRWEELADGLDRRDLTMKNALRRIEEEGDLFEPVLQGGQSLDQSTDTLGELVRP